MPRAKGEACVNVTPKRGKRLQIKIKQNLKQKARVRKEESETLVSKGSL